MMRQAGGTYQPARCAHVPARVDRPEARPV